MQNKNNMEQENCKPSSALFEVPSKKFKHQHHKTILLLLQYCKSVEEKVSAEKWMGSLRIKAKKCKYKEKDRRPLNC